MRRVILFRGKTTDTGEWIEGFYFYKDRTQEHGIHCSVSMGVLVDRAFEVIPETVGQFTGLTDKNGVKIFEGDVIQWTFGKHYWEAVVQSMPESQSVNLYTLETFHNCTKDMETEEYTYERSDSRGGFRNDVTYLSNKSEVIGNIHDNPELLK